jgi:4-hydroxy-tetrahydrodipicolinate reductase
VCVGMTVRVGVFGAGGRMGSTVCRAVAADPDLELVGAIDPYHAGLDLQHAIGVDVPDLHIAPDPAALLDARAQVVVDFTVLDASRRNLEWAAQHGIHAVVGTTGFTPEDHDRLRTLFTQSNCLIAPNFAIGAVLMMRFAELAAPWFDTAEVIELHHDRKVDAPSGTAMLTVERMAAASDRWGDDPTEKEVLAGARGATGPGGIHVHSVRLRPGRPSGGAPRDRRPVAVDPPRQLRPRQLHARRRAGGQAGGRPPRRDDRSRRPPRPLTRPSSAAGGPSGGLADDRVAVVDDEARRGGDAAVGRAGDRRGRRH